MAVWEPLKTWKPPDTEFMVVASKIPNVEGKVHYRGCIKSEATRTAKQLYKEGYSGALYKSGYFGKGKAFGWHGKSFEIAFRKRR